MVLDNDLDRRAPALLVDDLLRRRPPVIALATLEDRLTAQADVVLPTATFAEETGTCVNHEGRAQRYFAVQPPGDDVRPAWRWTRELLVRLGHREARGWKTPDDVLAALEMELPRFARRARRRAGRRRRRRDGRKVARQPLRWSGRTAIDADRTVFEPGPPLDPDSPLAYSLEGLQPPQSPDELRPRTWWPGWNSNNGLHKFGEELEALGPAQPSGVRLLDGGPPGGELPPVAAPARFAPRDGDVAARRACTCIYGSEPLSMYTPGVARARAGAVHRARTRRTPSASSVREGDWLAALAAVDGRAPALRARAVARDRHGRGARGPPRPALHLAAGARPSGARWRDRRERRPRRRARSSPPAPPPGTGSCSRCCSCSSSCSPSPPA